MKDKTQYPLTNREKRKRRRVKHNTHIQRETRVKEEGWNTIHTYKEKEEKKMKDKTQCAHTNWEKRKRRRI